MYRVVSSTLRLNAMSGLNLDCYKLCLATLSCIAMSGDEALTWLYPSTVCLILAGLNILHGSSITYMPPYVKK